MKCNDERQLGAHLANAAGGSQTRAAIEDKNKGFEDILRTAANECCEKGGLNVVVDKHSPRPTALGLCCAPLPARCRFSTG